MKNWIRVLIGIAILLVVLQVFSFFSGLVFWGFLAAAIGAAVWFGVRKVIRKKKARKDPKGMLKSKTESDIERLIKDMERMTGKS